MGHLWLSLMHRVRIVGGILARHYLIGNTGVDNLNLWRKLRVPASQSAGVVLWGVYSKGFANIQLCVGAAVTLALGAVLPLGMNHSFGELLELT